MASALALPVLQALAAVRFRAQGERDLQDGIEEALRSADVPFEREYVITPTCRIDFRVARSLGVEVKVAGTWTEVLRQLHRYALHDGIDELLLVTTRVQHRRLLPKALAGKPLAVLHVGGLA